MKRNPALESCLAFIALKIHVFTAMELVIKALNAYLPVKVEFVRSTDKASDGTRLLCESMVSWRMRNIDMHLTYLLMIKETLDPSKGFTIVLLSPT